MTTRVCKTGKGNLEAKYPRDYQDIRGKIEKGVLSGSLPSARELATDYDVNFMTVNKAIKKLESDGLVTCVPRKGTYVNRRYSVAAFFNDTCPNLLRVPIYNGVVMAAQQYFLTHHYPMYLESSPLDRSSTDSLRSRIDGMLLFYNENFPLDNELLQLPFVRVMGNSDTNRFCPTFVVSCTVPASIHLKRIAWLDATTTFRLEEWVRRCSLQLISGWLKSAGWLRSGSSNGWRNPICRTTKSCLSPNWLPPTIMIPVKTRTCSVCISKRILNGEIE